MKFQILKNLLKSIKCEQSELKKLGRALEMIEAEENKIRLMQYESLAKRLKK